MRPATLFDQHTLHRCLARLATSRSPRGRLLLAFSPPLNQPPPPPHLLPPYRRLLNPKESIPCCLSGRSLGGGSEREREAEGEDQRSKAAVRTHWKAGKGHSATVGQAIGTPDRGLVWLHHQSWRREKAKTKGRNS